MRYPTALREKGPERKRRRRALLRAVALVLVFTFSYALLACTSPGSTGLNQGTGAGINNGLTTGNHTTGTGGTNGTTTGTTGSPSPTTTPIPQPTGFVPTENFNEIGMPGENSQVGAVAFIDGNIWFTDQGQQNFTVPLGAFEVITPSGTLVASGNTISIPVGITLGFDGKVWITEQPIAGPITVHHGGGNDESFPNGFPAGLIERIDPANFGPAQTPTSAADLVPVVPPPAPPACPLTAGPFPRQYSVIDLSVDNASNNGGLSGNCPVTRSPYTTPADQTNLVSGNNIISGTITQNGVNEPAMYFTDSCNRLGIVFTDTDPSSAQNGGYIVSSQLVVNGFLSSGDGTIGGGAGTNGITLGPDGKAWFTETNSGLIGALDPNGALSEFNQPVNNTTPVGITAGPDGNMWYCQNTGNQIGRIDLNGDAVAPIRLITPNAGPIALAKGPDGNVWVTEKNVNRLAVVLGSAPNSVVERIIPMQNFLQDSANPSPPDLFPPLGLINGAAQGITTDGTNLDFGGPAFNLTGDYPMGTQVGISDTSGNMRIYTDALSSGFFESPSGLCIDPTTGNFVMTELNGASLLPGPPVSANATDTPGQVSAHGNSICIADKTTGVVTQIGNALPKPNSFPEYIVVGPDGNYWFTEEGNNAIGRMTPAGVLTEFPLSASGDKGPFYICVGPDGALWFTEERQTSQGGNNVGRIATTATVSGGLTNAGPTGLQEFPLTTANSNPQGICVGGDGNLWVCEQNANQIARVTTSGAVTEFAVPTAGSFPSIDCLGPDGNVWFTENVGNNVAKITPSGAVSEFAVPIAGVGPWAISAGQDGGIWFTGINLPQTLGHINIDGTGVVTFNNPTIDGEPFDLRPVGTAREFVFSESAREKICTFTY
jgi:streptogramin lyase